METNDKLQARPDKQKEQYDKTSKQPLHPLFLEDHVRIFDPSSSTWEPGIVQCAVDTPRSYLVASGKGGVQFIREDIPVADSSLQPALWERDAGGGAGCSSVEPESVSVSPNVDLTAAPQLRRSSRGVKAPERLNL